MPRLTYYFFKTLVLFFKILPFFIIYLLSDFIYILFYYIVRYRKKVVFDNLQKSFPEKTDPEIKRIAKEFYKNLSDITIESIKGLTMSEAEMLNRYKVLNPEVSDKYFEQGKDVMNLASHYCNWEWGIQAVDMQFKHSVVSIYKPLTNKFIEKYMTEKRERTGMTMISIRGSRDFFMTKKKQPVSYIMAGDQNPLKVEKAIWVDFLGRKTACLHGIESMAKQANMPMVYYDVQRVKRGYYTLNVVDFMEFPKNTEKGEITQKYMTMLEGIIRKNPANWLWSHKRWKHAYNELEHG